MDRNVFLGFEASASSALLLTSFAASAAVCSDDQVAPDAASTAAAILYPMSGEPNTSPAEFPSRVNTSAYAVFQKFYEEEMLPEIAVQGLSMF